MRARVVAGEKQDGKARKKTRAGSARASVNYSSENSLLPTQACFNDIVLNSYTFIQDVCIICDVFRNAIVRMNHENDTRNLDV